MKTKKTPPFSDVFNEIKRAAKFPRRLPIIYENFNCGTLIIDYSPKPFRPLADGNVTFRQLAQVSILPEIVATSMFWKHDIELGMNLRNMYIAKTHRLLNLLLSYDYNNEQREKPRGRDSYPLGDDLVFDFIKSAGPAALRVMAVMAVLQRWLKDPKRVGAKLEKLADALIHYQTGKERAEIRFSDGRPASEPIEYLGGTIIKEFYKDLTSFLKLAKKIKGQAHFDNKEEAMVRLKKLIEDSSLAYLCFLEAEAKKRPDDQNIGARLRRLHEIYNKGDQRKPYSFVFDCLKEDPELLAEFSIRISKPNLMAKEIVGKLIGVSSETITNVLYPRQTKKQKEHE